MKALPYRLIQIIRQGILRQLMERIDEHSFETLISDEVIIKKKSKLACMLLSIREEKEPLYPKEKNNKQIIFLAVIVCAIIVAIIVFNFYAVSNAWLAIDKIENLRVFSAVSFGSGLIMLYETELLLFLLLIFCAYIIMTNFIHGKAREALCYFPLSEDDMLSLNICQSLKPEENMAEWWSFVIANVVNYDKEELASESVKRMILNEAKYAASMFYKDNPIDFLSGKDSFVEAQYTRVISMMDSSEKKMGKIKERLSGFIKIQYRLMGSEIEKKAIC